MATLRKIPDMQRFHHKDFEQAFRRIPYETEGRVCDVVGNVIEARLPFSRLGTVAEIELEGQEQAIHAEVVGFRDQKVLLLPFCSLSGISPGAFIKGHLMLDKIAVGDFLKGQVIDPFGKPLMPSGKLGPEHPLLVPIEKDAPNPLMRSRINRPLSLGVRTLDGLLSFGEGQRIGIMAGSGVGKSVLMGMIARGSASDVNVIGLIGERGREVREFIEKELGEEGLARSVVVVVTSDQSPLMRLRAAKVVTAIAEYFSSLGQRVLLMMDSLTRVAQAQREIGLSVGEAATSKGYPPSVFSLLPRLLERCGPQMSGAGSISGLYTVLVDGDDFNDPMPDAARSILDGHINLSRSLAARGHFPAIAVSTSVSRVMHDIVSPQHARLAQQLKAMISSYEENIDLIQTGNYRSGTNLLLDRAIESMPAINHYLQQPMDKLSNFDEAVTMLAKLLSGRQMADAESLMA